MSDRYVKCMDREFQPRTLRELFEKDEDEDENFNKLNINYDLNSTKSPS